MRILALDYGERRIGMAWSDPLRSMAFPLKTLLVQSVEDLFTELELLLAREPISEVLLSYPKLMNDTAGSRAHRTADLKVDLEERLKIPVILWDERLTTKLAAVLLREVSLSGKKRRQTLLDKTSAQILLQNYLDYCRAHKTSPAPEEVCPLAENSEDPHGMN